MKRKGNLTQMLLNIVKTKEVFPVVISNKDFPIIEESAYIIKALEDDGYKVKTFSKNGIYGIEVWR